MCDGGYLICILHSTNFLNLERDEPKHVYKVVLVIHSSLHKHIRGEPVLWKVSLFLEKKIMTVIWPALLLCLLLGDSVVEASEFEKPILLGVIWRLHPVCLWLNSKKRVSEIMVCICICSVRCYRLQWPSFAPPYSLAVRTALEITINNSITILLLLMKTCMTFQGTQRKRFSNMSHVCLQFTEKWDRQFQYIIHIILYTHNW